MNVLEPTLKCPECRAKFTVDLTENVSEVIESERKGVPEKEYVIDNCVFTCPGCHREISASGSIYESPEKSIRAMDLDLMIDYML